MADETSSHWHSLKIDEIKKGLGTSESGLSQREAELCLQEYGFNEIKAEKPISPFHILICQFKDALIMMLLLATVISAVLGELIDSVVISIIVILSVLLGFVQEFRAERAAEALKKMISPSATVIREGVERQIDAKNLVPGDVIKISSGDRIAGDARLFKVDSLQVDESPLTGESIPIEKNNETLDEDVILAERTNMAFSGTVATYGKGLGMVVATGMRSEFGRIAGMLQEVKEEKTPLQKRMEEIGKWLLGASVLVVSMVTGLGLIRGYGLFEMFLWGVSLAVAAVPEALPAVVTGSLAIGMRKMAERNAIVKTLPAVETLGSTTVICSDKTGTLTKGEMTVRKIYYDDEMFDVTGSGYSTNGRIERVEKLKQSILPRIAILCNESNLISKDGEFEIQGQPTEAALLIMALKAGESIEKVRRMYPEIATIPFSSERKRMTTIHEQKNEEKIAAVKGAPEVILKLCNWVCENDKIEILDDNKRKKILEINDEMAKHALRVIALAYRELSPETEKCTEECEKSLVFIGLAGMIDPPREEVKFSINKCKKAGIRVIMITGDNKLTALAIAKDLELTDDDHAIEGKELSKMTDGDLYDKLDSVNVFARITPEDKLRIVKILKTKNEIVAVTGDGVNDAPALKHSDIGIAMGITGTEVTKEASDMILMDDNFATIVSAIERGRGTFDNIRKYLSFLLSSNAGEILVMFIAGLMGFPLPLIALQILWVNLVTDGLPAIALSIDPPELDVMDRPPRSPRASVFDKHVNSIIFIIGGLMAVICLIVFNWYLQKIPFGVLKAQTMVFTTMVIFELFNSFNCRSIRYSIFKIGVFKNKYLILAVAFSTFLQLVIIYVPLFNVIFKTFPLNLNDWLIIIVASIPSIIGVEVAKFFLNKN